MNHSSISISSIVEKHFSGRVQEYDESASLQKEVARKLGRSLEPWRLTLPPGPVLEVGAGTGYLTEELYKLLPERELIATDLSQAMVEWCREHLSGMDGVQFDQMDAESFEPNEIRYALVASSFAAQWFRDPALTLGRFAEALLPGGLLLASFPGEDSFPEWRERCMELGLPWTGNPFPKTEEMVIKLSMGPAQVDYYEEPVQVSFPDALSFFRHLKQLGADASLHGKQLSAKDFRLLLREWDRKRGGKPLQVTWHLVFLALKRDT